MSGFDGKTCPGCDESLRSVGASLFNARNRYPEASMMSKLWDCKQFHPVLPEPAADAHPAIHAMHKVYKYLMDSMEVVVQDGNTIRWAPGVMARIRRIEPEWTDALVAYEEIKEQHFRDDRHCRGELNWMCEQRGSEHTLWGRRPDTSYNRFVAWVGEDEEHNLVHKACGARIMLDDYFLERLREDETFYGKGNCPSCKAHMVPFTEFEIVTLETINRNTCG